MDDGRRTNPDFGSPTKAADIWITNSLQIECPDHGVFDEIPVNGNLPRAVRAADAIRTRHWNDEHGD
jgi:hypothetical protein